MLLAIDPGIDTGAAWFGAQGNLYGCYLQSDLDLLGGLLTKVIIERPQVYPGMNAKKANDLITLAIRVGRYVRQAEDAGAEVRIVLPHEWKGNTPKDIHGRRVKAALSEQELCVFSRCGATKSKMHNVLDAIGLGLFALGRLRP